MSAIFISYRRSDAGGYAGRLFECLRQWFDEDELFYDLDSIDAGDDFPARLENGIRKAKVVLVVIGPDWVNSLNMRAASSVTDFVRREVELALKLRAEHGVPKVIPILVGGAAPPDGLSPALASSLGGICALDMHEFHGKQSDWDAQFMRLRDLIANVPGVPTPRLRVRTNADPRHLSIANSARASAQPAAETAELNHQPPFWIKSLVIPAIIAVVGAAAGAYWKWFADRRSPARLVIETITADPPDPSDSAMYVGNVRLEEFSLDSLGKARQGFRPEQHEEGYVGPSDAAWWRARRAAEPDDGTTFDLPTPNDAGVAIYGIFPEWAVRPPGMDDDMNPPVRQLVLRVTVRNVGERDATLTGYRTEPVALNCGGAGSGGYEILPVNDVPLLVTASDLSEERNRFSQTFGLESDATGMFRFRVRYRVSYQGDGAECFWYKFWLTYFDGVAEQSAYVGAFYEDELALPRCGSVNQDISCEVPPRLRHPQAPSRSGSSPHRSDQKGSGG